MTDTIFALATAQGRAGVAVVRVSGSEAVKGCARIAALPEAGRFKLSSIRDLDGQLLDRGLVLFFENGASFTGEDVVEMQLHGSVAVVNAVLETLSKLPNFRLAEPGEFTRRALENGQLSLSEVEGLSDLLSAETEVQRKVAMRVFSGVFTEKALGWRKDLIRARALLEASMDFADEEVPTDVLPEVTELVGSVKHDVCEVLENSNFSEKIRSGFEIAIIGPPNIGKSTLINRIVGRDVAIVSDIAGTTRDVIEAQYDLNGLPVVFFDTAGIRETDDVIEAEGVRRAVERAENADVRVHLCASLDDDAVINLSENDIVVVAKGDQNREGISGLTGQGVDKLLSDISTILSAKVPRDVSTIRRRQFDGLSKVVDCLSLAMASNAPEMCSFELQSGLNHLGFVVGFTGTEDILDEVFSSFCLGK